MAIEQLNEQLALVACIDPADKGTGTHASDVIDMALHHRCLFTVASGLLDQGTTVDFKVQESIAGGATWVDLTGKAITTFDATDDNSQARVEVCDDEMTETYRYLRGVLTVTHATEPTGCGLLTVWADADRCRYKPSSLQDLASVVEIVQ